MCALKVKSVKTMLFPVELGETVGETFISENFTRNDTVDASGSSLI